MSATEPMDGAQRASLRRAARLLTDLSARLTVHIPGELPIILVVARACDVLTAAATAIHDAALSDQGQRTRHDRLRRQRDRNDFLAARVLALLTLSALVGSDPVAIEIRQHCQRCGKAHGRPLVQTHPELHVTWAHTGGLVAVAAGTAPVGVDLERMRAQPPPTRPVGKHANDPRSADPLTAWLGWTRGEALVKLGAAPLDIAITWPLKWRPSLSGATIHAALLPGAVSGRDFIIADLLSDHGQWVASVAAASSGSEGSPLIT